MLWASGRLPEYLIALLFAAAMILHVAPAEIAFVGFLSAAFWLALSSVVLVSIFPESRISGHARSAGLPKGE